jgi:biotin carboxyl carrier protein
MAKKDITSEVTGTVTEILVEPGQVVKAGDIVMVLDSMKMEVSVEALAAGKVSEVVVEQGEAVSEGQTLLVLDL